VLATAVGPALCIALTLLLPSSRRPARRAEPVTASV
jgi:hypothetical protein